MHKAQQIKKAYKKRKEKNNTRGSCVSFIQTTLSCHVVIEVYYQDIDYSSVVWV